MAAAVNWYLRIAIAFALVASVCALQILSAPSSSAGGNHSAQSGVRSSLPAGYVGDAACQSCHAEKAETFHRTAHFLTSRLPDKDSILGTFAAGANGMKTSNPELFFRMEQKGDQFFQTAVEGTDPFITERSERFAFVVGSGGKGQTYLYWKGDELFQLPVSYWSELGWVNSPGYRDGAANFARPVIPRCLECHGTYFESAPPPENRYRRDGFIVGIACEKCHGPGQRHAQSEAAKAAPGADSGVLNAARFPRERQMDLCAWCHAGVGVSLRPAFSYVPGQRLEEYLRLPQPDASAPVDVHGSQVEMLERSRCYQKSGLTCLTCHDLHRVQHDLATFSKQCLSCHKPESATFSRKDHPATANCIDCHMPLQETNLIVFDQNGKRARPRIRSHWIRVYAESGVSSKVDFQVDLPR